MASCYNAFTTNGLPCCICCGQEGKSPCNKCIGHTPFLCGCTECSTIEGCKWHYSDELKAHIERGKPYKFTQETLDALAQLPQPPDNNNF